MALVEAGARVAAAPSTVEVVDGRRARRERGRAAVVDAMVDLIEEGVVPPSADLVAKRAAVSVASVFRYFDSVADLQEAAMQRFFERYADLFEIPSLGVGSLADRIDGLAGARLELYEMIEPAGRLMRARAIDHATLARGLTEARIRLAAQLGAHFEPELAELEPSTAADLVGVASTLVSFESWDQLRQGLGRTRPQIHRAWTAALTALF